MVKVSAYLRYGLQDYGLPSLGGKPPQPLIASAKPSVALVCESKLDVRKGTLQYMVSAGHPGMSFMGIHLPSVPILGKFGFGSGIVWKPLYVIASPTHLYAYESSAKNDPPVIVIDLGDVRVADGEAEIGWPFSFIVTVKKGEPNERWVFHTANQAESASWMNAILQGSKSFQQIVKKYVLRQVIVLQAHVRGAIARMRHGQELKHHRASRRIGRWWRKIFNKRKFKRLLEATLVLQSYVRRWQAQRIVFQLRFERDIAIHQKKRTNIVQEILQTEENYVRDLDTLVKVFLKPLRALFANTTPSSGTGSISSGSMTPEKKALLAASSSSPNLLERKALGSSSPSLISPDKRALALGVTGGSSGNLLATADKNATPSVSTATVTGTTIDEIFGNIEAISAAHHEALPRLKEVLEHWDEHAQLGGLFEKLANTIKNLYIVYGVNYDKALLTLDYAKKNEKFKHCLDTAGSVRQVKRLDLDGFLILPIQRMPRYVLLLKDLHKRTWKNHSDYAALSTALEKMQDATKAMNEERKINSNRQKMEELKTKFANPSELQDIGVPDTMLCLLEGPLLIQDAESEKVKSYGILFSDFFVVARRTTDRQRLSLVSVQKSYRFSNAVQYKVSEMKATKLPPVKGYGFQVQFNIGGKHKRAPLTVFTKTDEQTDTWLWQIKEARMAVVGNRSGTLSHRKSIILP